VQGVGIVATFKIEGMDELEAYMRDMGRLPQKVVTKAARKGAMIIRRVARKGGWIDQSGELRKGIVLKGEKAKIKGKKVYQVVMDSAKNDIFVKMTKSGKRYYYPASQEYGFKTKNGGYTPGFHFLRNALVDNSRGIEKVMVDIMSKEIDKLK
jgi:hypothetical protein